ncbi:proprotein convertase P-domain-containing protein [Siansivirga zeaxanthinifaciens]|uniref:P/Homo B domain-containing protein n=1 Tax=Siansivirga zeaxanthinifaciens CC-SAMT-1 TaxID=1454006 RepID=A0A0C5WFD0_9FLAO|nr:proprotein convertase P-domain-containing protein [Siansivirga zeaxanthinifaciens]AJR04907.1 hypothetical protein AW14_09045 [Siansivirga zeaxanthinifaciens CC-SAMT-1]
MKSLKVLPLSLILFFVFILSSKFYAQNICTFYTENPGTSISNSYTVTPYETVINVPESFIITDVNVIINISHNRNQDLDIYLISPSGTVVELSTDNGGNGNNYNNVTFDDASLNTLPTFNTTLSGTYRPEGSLASFNGENSNGNWVVSVSDDRNGTGGTINSVTINLCYAIPSPPIGGYTGPGGVGSNDGNSDLVIWYRPDNGISTSGTSVNSWSNSAGIPALDISETGTQRPSLDANAINGYDEVDFNGFNRLRTGLNLNTSNFITDKASSFLVSKADNTWQSSSVYTTDPLEVNRFSNHVPWSGSVYYDIGSCCTNNARIEVGGLTGLNNYSIWSYLADAATGKQLYRNQTLLQDRANTLTYNSHATHRFNIGGNTTGTNGFYGSITELVIYKTKVNTAQRIIIDNYLAAKYNQTLAFNDIYDQDNAGNGNFDHHVAGIGQASDGTNHTDSQGTGIVRINNPSMINNNTFLFWGEETRNPTYNFTTNTTNYTEQLNSRWRVSRQGNLGTVTVSFDISSLDLSGKPSCAPLQLVEDNNYDFSSPINVYNLTIVGNTATATGVEFQNNRYFTLRYAKEIVWDGTTYFNGSGLNNAPNTADACYKLIIKAGATATLNTDAYVNEIEVEPGATLYVSDGVLIRVDNEVVINGTIDLLGEAQLIQNHTGTNLNSGSGSLKIRQQGTSNFYNYNYLSAPVNRGGFWQVGYLKDAAGTTINFTSALNANPNTSPITLSNRWLYKFKGPSNDYFSWKKISTSSNLEPGIGFTIKGSGSTTANQEYIFEGLPNNGDYNIPVTAGTDILTGNPYPSALDADQFIIDNASIIDGTLYFWESFDSNNSHYLSNYEGGYATYNLMGVSLPAVADTSGLTSGNGTASKPAPTQYINIGQGFFTTIISTGNLTFNNGQRQFARESLGETVFYKSVNKKGSSSNKIDNRSKVWFSFTAPAGITKTIGLGYDKDHATYNYDKGYDAKSYDALRNDIYWFSNNEPLAILALPEINTEDSLPLRIKVSDAGIYKFNISKIENIPDYLNIFLHHKTENKYYNLKNGEATLLLKKGTINDYSIVFKEDNTLGTKTIKETQFITTYNPETKILKVISKNEEAFSSFEIFNGLGQSVIKIKNPDSNNINLATISNGIYILKITTTDSVISRNIKFIKD